jgi:hypothetical protein
MSRKARLLQLAADLAAERDALDRILDEAERCLVDLRHRAPSPLEVRGAGDIVHDFYNVVERYLERIAGEMNGALPAGPDSHARLLAGMTRELPEIRPAVLDNAMRARLDEYLRFRHLFRQGYGFALEWSKIRRVPPVSSSVPSGLRLRARMVEDCCAARGDDGDVRGVARSVGSVHRVRPGAGRIDVGAGVNPWPSYRPCW